MIARREFESKGAFKAQLYINLAKDLATRIERGYL